VAPRKRIQVDVLRDFRGGLNLRGDVFNLGLDESPDLLNVDVGQRGGFRQRRGVAPLTSTALGGEIRTLLEYSSSTGNAQVLAADGTNVYKSTGGSFSSVFAMTGAVRGATFKDRLYVANGSGAGKRWDGATATTLGVAHNENMEAPTASASTGNMPQAFLVAAHMGHLWVAHTTEGGNSYPNRVRFSHPNFPEDWRLEDFIDVDAGVDGDEITALVPYADRLLVFKKRSIHAIFGSDPETFQVFTVTAEVGAPTQEAVCATDLGIYFFSWPDGVFLYDGRNVTWQFERLMPAIQDGKIPSSYADKIMLGWGNRRLWVSVPWLGTSTRDRVFVLDPSLTKSGSWVAYDLAVGPFVEFNPPGANSLFLAADIGTNRVLKLDQRVPYDNFGGDDTPIVANYRTSWIDHRNQAVPKRWKRPDVVLRGGTTAEISVIAYHDWDPTIAQREFKLNTVADSDEMASVVTDPESGAAVGSGWGAVTWDNFRWARSSSWGATTEPITQGRNELHRGSQLGTSKALSLAFSGPETTEEWGVESIALKLIERRLRS
jgi:hypothetical protein